MNTKKLLKTISSNFLKSNDQAEALFSDPILSFVYKKIERINSALYLITNHIKDTEPIKSTIRKKSIEMVDIILSYRNLSIQKDDPEAKAIIANYLGIMSYIETAVISGLIKDTNYFILHSEINAVLEIFYKKITDNTLIESDLRDTVLSLRTEFVTQGTNKSSKGQKYIKDIVKDKKLNVKDIKKRNEGDGFFEKKYAEIMSEKKVVLNGLSKMGEKNARREKIIKSFSPNKVYSLKDIAISLPELSEKTVQRELNTLVSGGVLYKEGERRWTKYFLAK